MAFLHRCSQLPAEGCDIRFYLIGDPISGIVRERVVGDMEIPLDLCRGQELMMVLRERAPRTGDYEVLRSYELKDLGLRWEYVGDGRFSAGFEVFEGEVWLGDSDGTVRRFQ